MKKVILTIAAATALLSSEKAQGYDKISLGYDHTKFNTQISGVLGTAHTTMGLNGVGVGYRHGFGIANNLFLETGAGIHFLSGSEMQVSTRMIYGQVPVNLVFDFPITEGVSIAPYAGTGLMVNALSQSKTGGSGWVSHFDAGDYSYNRFQVGWQTGFLLNYDKYFFGVEYGSDILPVFDKTLVNVRTRINKHGVKIHMGYTF